MGYFWRKFLPPVNFFWECFIVHPQIWNIKSKTTTLKYSFFRSWGKGIWGKKKKVLMSLSCKLAEWLGRKSILISRAFFSSRGASRQQQKIAVEKEKLAMQSHWSDPWSCACFWVPLVLGFTRVFFWHSSFWTIPSPFLVVCEGLCRRDLLSPESLQCKEENEKESYK